MSRAFWERPSFKRFIFFLLIVLAVVPAVAWLESKNPSLPRRPMIIYSVLLLLLVGWILLKGPIVQDAHDYLSEKIVKSQADLHQSYLTNYKHKYPQTLEFVAARNVGFVPLYFINLDRSPGRRMDLEKDLEKYGLRAKRISGVDGQKIRDLRGGEIDGLRFVSYDGDRSPAEIGCVLSHFKAIKQAFDDGHDLSIIMEDDTGLDLVPHWRKTLHQFIEELPGDWTIVNLKPDCYVLDRITSYRDRHCWNAGVYLINRAGMEKILGLRDGGAWVIKKYGGCGSGSADCLLYHAIPGAYSAPDALFFTKPQASTVGNPIFTGFLKSAMVLDNFN